MVIGGVECEHPAAGDTVLSRRVDEERCAGTGMAAKSLRCAVDADVLNTHLPRNGLRDIKSRAKNASVRHPEEALGIETKRRGVSAAAEAVTGAVAKFAVLAAGITSWTAMEVVGIQLPS